MSRCFPFPPPGYEKKARPDDENLLAKEKHKEKKHKKEKKEREKRESKDKKDKERSEEKHREKKDRKEKHKDKKEKRSKDKDKHEKKKSSDRKNITVLPPPQPKSENRDVEENLGAISTTTTDKHKDNGESRRTLDNTNINLLPLPVNHNGEEILRALSTTTTDKQKDKGEKRRTLDNTNITLLPLPKNRNGSENLTTTDDTTEFKFLFELGQRSRDSERATENPLLQKINLSGQRSSVMESNMPSLAKGNDFAKAKREEDNGKNQKQSRTKDMEIDPVKRNSEKPPAEKESKRKHGSESKKEKHKDKDREKKSKSKDKKKEKKEKEEKTKDKKADKDPQQQIIRKEISKDNSEEFRNIRPPSEQPIGIILGKRKEQKVNGFLPDNDIRPNKLSRLATSSPQIVENGSTGPPQKPNKDLKPNGVNISSVPQVAADNGKTAASSVWQGTGNNHKLDDKVSPSPINLEYERISDLAPTSTPLPKHSGYPNFDNKALLSQTVTENGRKLELCQTASSTKPGVSDICEVDEKSRSGINSLTKVQEPSTKFPLRAKGIVVEARPPVKKPPHPDLKYLSQILVVPSVEWSDVDDQQWLFGNKEIKNAENTRSGPSQVEEETQVWAEALRMESADITALPYVIPY